MPKLEGKNHPFAFRPCFLTFHPSFYKSDHFYCIIYLCFLERFFNMNLSHNISSKIVNFMVRNQIISSTKIDCYLYCYEFVSDLLIYNISIFILGCIIGQPFLAMLYIITITPTKMLAGGAHANSRKMCSFISYTITILIFLLSQLSVNIDYTYLIISFLFCMISIIILSPVGTPNKTFPLIRKKSLKKYCFYYSLFLLMLYLFLSYKRMYQYILLMTLCVIIITVNQYIGIRVNKKYGEKEAC